MKQLAKYSNTIKLLCDKHKVKSLYAFGSLLTDNFNDKSDIDLVVDFYPVDLKAYTDNYFALKFSLEELFKRPVDLLEAGTIKNPYFKESVTKNRQRVYGQ